MSSETEKVEEKLHTPETENHIGQDKKTDNVGQDVETDKVNLAETSSTETEEKSQAEIFKDELVENSMTDICNTKQVENVEAETCKTDQVYITPTEICKKVENAFSETDKVEQMECAIGETYKKEELDETINETEHTDLIEHYTFKEQKECNDEHLINNRKEELDTPLIPEDGSIQTEDRCQDVSSVISSHKELELETKNKLALSHENEQHLPEQEGHDSVSNLSCLSKDVSNEGSDSMSSKESDSKSLELSDPLKSEKKECLGETESLKPKDINEKDKINGNGKNDSEQFCPTSTINAPPVVADMVESLISDDAKDSDDVNSYTKYPHVTEDKEDMVESLISNDTKESDDVNSYTKYPHITEEKEETQENLNLEEEKEMSSNSAGNTAERNQRIASTGFDVQENLDDYHVKQKDIEMIEEESNSSFGKFDDRINSADTLELREPSYGGLDSDVTPSPYVESEMSETPGPPTPASVNSMADSSSLQAYENFGPPTPSSSIAESASIGPTPSKRSRMSVHTPSQEKITAQKLYEYQWPNDSSGEYYMLQEQVCEYLGVKSFKRKYPDLFRRQVDIKERVFLMEKGAVTEHQADLGLTALRSEEVCDLMHRDYPTMYQEYAEVLHERQKQKISEKHKEYEVPKLEKSKMTQYIKKAMKSVSEWNANFLKERREERRAYLDLQTFNIHYPTGRYKKMPPEATKISPYPVALIPGQFQEYYKKYSPDEMKYFPMNTTLFNPPKRMGSTLANPQEQAEAETASEEDENASGSDSDSGDDSSSSDGTSGGEDGDKKIKEDTSETKEAALTDPNICTICTKGKNPDIHVESDLVHCSECKKGGHPGCLDLTDEMVTVIKTYPWQCMDCKTCVECMDPYDEDKMMFCDLCDRGYHTFCVGLKSIPTGRWKCKSCKGPETPKTPKTPKNTKTTAKANGTGTGKKRGRPPLNKNKKALLEKEKAKLEKKREKEEKESQEGEGEENTKKDTEENKEDVPKEKLEETKQDGEDMKDEEMKDDMEDMETDPPKE